MVNILFLLIASFEIKLDKYIYLKYAKPKHTSFLL